MKISFITTVFNEKNSIETFLKSLNDQSTQPDEIIIVDGGSGDDTVARIEKFAYKIKKVSVLVKKGNRSVGRNEGISHATGDVIVCSDAGNILDGDWVKNITEPFHIHGKDTDVVAGYYKGTAKNVFQKCIIPYALVMPDKVDPHNFLPATRSIAFTKKIWEKAGKFDERLSHNEDYAFAHALKKAGANIVFKKDAIVHWIPRNTFKEACIMFYRFAYGDAEAKLWRPKVMLLFVRYILAILLIILAIIMKSAMLAVLLIALLAAYCIWAINKQYRYVQELEAIYILPALQFTADFAVISGTIGGILHIWDIQKTQ